MKSRKKFLLVITLVIAGLLMLGTMITPAIKITSENNINIQPMELNIEKQTLSMQITDMNIHRNLIPHQVGYPEFSYEGDQLHPAFDVDINNYYIAAYEDDYAENIIWTFTPDDGAYFSIPQGYYPSIKNWADTRFFGTLVPDYSDSDGGVVYLFEAQDPLDFETYTLVGWDWSDNGWSDILDIEIACDNSKEVWEWGFMSLVASTTYGDGVNDGPFVMYQTSEDGYASISWYLIEGCEHTDNIIDKSTLKAYSVYDVLDDEFGPDYGVFIRMDYWDDWDRDGTGYIYTGDGNLQYPSIAAYDDNIVTVMQTDEEGNSDIICLYGSDLEFLDTSVVVETDDDEMYPDVQHLEGTTFICTYVKDGKLYGCKTEDAGESWSDSWIISDGGVIEEYKTSDLSSNAVQVLWEQMGEDIDIWKGSALDNSPPDPPIITGPSKVRKGDEENYVFKAEDPESEQIYLWIEWGDGTPSLGWQGPYNSGQEKTFSHAFAEEGTYIVSARAKDTNNLEGPWGYLEVTSPTNQDPTTTLLIRIIQILIDTFPILEPILGPILANLQ